MGPFRRTLSSAWRTAKNGALLVEEASLWAEFGTKVTLKVSKASRKEAEAAFKAWEAEQAAKPTEKKSDSKSDAQ